MDNSVSFDLYYDKNKEIDQNQQNHQTLKLPDSQQLGLDQTNNSRSLIQPAIEDAFFKSEVNSEHIANSYQNNSNNFLGITKVKLESSMVSSIPQNSNEKVHHQKKKSQYMKTLTNQFQEYENVFKIIMIGSSFTGKTSLLFRFVNDSFDKGYLNTVGVDLKTVTLKIHDTMARVNIWDTTGQEKFKSLTKSYFRNCHGAVAVFDLTKRESFYSIEQSIKEFRLNCPPESKDNIVLVGNKVDLENQRQVSHDDAQNLTKRLGLLQYFETSASSNLNVDQLFFTVAHQSYQIEKEQQHNNEILGQQNIKLSGDSNGIRGRTSTSIQLEQYGTVKKKRRSACC
ncbi:ras-related protein rab-35-like [Stylonychia lemnae]|uniref:Ras-related protein rab-35-like n=1 Tax=Stylonychia lemnae TaxID=5949 RepID=A0A078AXZ6_STYLE|nr:ras-related protein rab-35-like [Stylonychia lemnae]|eukprot:CDW86971.1 ras-related protein rab-35-like [Stylonychia lemnae]